MADNDSLSGRQLGEFVLRAKIGEGGFASVYRCDQPLLGREAVVKVLHKRRPAHDGALSRFTREALLASRLDHPYAAHVYGCGVENDGLLWIAMEMVHGVTLRRWLQTRGPLALEQFVPLFERIAEVVQAAHERGIVHCDLKPSNIMVVERAGQLLPKLLDFGIARFLGDAEQEDAFDHPLSESFEESDPDSTAVIRVRVPPGRRRPRPVTSNVVKGSPPYMAPEQWTAPRTVGPAADLYALGIVAYEALTGRPPFDVSTDNVDELAELHRTGSIPPYGVESAPGMDRFFQRALAKRPEDRFGNALELAAALRAEMDSRMLARVRSAAAHWHEKGRMVGLLWRDDALSELKTWREHGSRAGALVKIELEFIDASCTLEDDQREAKERRAAWLRRGAAALGVMLVAIVFWVFQSRATYETQLAQQKADTARQVAEATAVDSEVEQGRAALLHDDLVEAQRHLAEAVRRGDHSPATAFMLARAEQPLHAEQARFAASSGRMWSAAWSPDGGRIVTTDDRAAEIWDIARRSVIATLEHGDTVHDAKYSPDGTTIVTAGNDGTVRLWCARDGAPIRTLRPRGGAPRYFVTAMSPDGRLVAAIDVEGAIAHVWSVDTGAVLAELANNGRGMPSVGFSHDGMWLEIGGGADLHIIDTATWSRAATITGPVRRIAWDPHGPGLATTNGTGDVSIWRMPSGARTAHLREVGEPVDAVAWSPDGRLIAAATRDGAIQVWAADTHLLLSQNNQLHDRIFSIEFDAKSQLIAAAGASGAVAIGEAATGVPVSLLQGPTKLVRTVHFSPTDHYVLGASWDGTARIWDATSPYRRWSTPAFSEDCGVVTSLQPDQRVVAIPCRDRSTRVWDTARDEQLAELPPTSVLPAVTATGDRVAIARGNQVEIYEMPGEKLLRRVKHSAAVTAIAFAERGQDLVSGAADGSLLVTGDGRDPRALPAAHHEIDAVAMLAHRVLASDADGHLHVLGADDGRALATLDTRGRLGLLRPSPAGNRLIGVPAEASTAAPVLWDLATYRMISRLEGHVGRVFTARWVAGDRILSASTDGSARMWDSTGAMLVSYRGATRTIVDVALSPSGDFVVGGGGDGRLRFWDAATGRPLWTTQAHNGPLVGLHFESEDVITRGAGGDLGRWHVSSK